MNIKGAEKCGRGLRGVKKSDHMFKVLSIVYEKKKFRPIPFDTFFYGLKTKITSFFFVEKKGIFLLTVFGVYPWMKKIFNHK